MGIIEGEVAGQTFSDPRWDLVPDVAGRTAGSYLAPFPASQGVESGDALIAAAAAATGVRPRRRKPKHHPMPGLNFFEL